LAKASQSSVEVTARIESGQSGDLLTLLRIAQVLHVADSLMEACKPPPASLDEIERMEELIQTEGERQAGSLSEPSA
jgi:hypothetical protein